MFLLLLLGLQFELFAQEVISTQGSSYVNSEVSIDFTIGETLINTFSDGSNDLTQGFHQTNWSLAGVDNFNSEVNISLYPNPMADELTLETTFFNGLCIKMYDSKGRQVLSDEITSQKTRLNVSHLSPGSYTFSVFDHEQVWKSYKLIKSQ